MPAGRQSLAACEKRIKWVDKSGILHVITVKFLPRTSPYIGCGVEKGRHSSWKNLLLLFMQAAVEDEIMLVTRVDVGNFGFLARGIPVTLIATPSRLPRPSSTTVRNFEDDQNKEPLTWCRWLVLVSSTTSRALGGDLAILFTGDVCDFCPAG